MQAAPGKVSITQDGWSADTTKAGFQGMTAHWIEVKEGKWKMKAAVIGFNALSGGHRGENLGGYSVGLLDRVGIMDKKNSKVCHLSRKIPIANTPSLICQLYTATLDNTGNNNTTCKTIQDIHARQGLEWNSDKRQLPSVFYIFSQCFSLLISITVVWGTLSTLGMFDVMGHITKIAAVENATAIWEYDPTREDNRVLGGSLDVIAAIRTLAIKVIVVLSIHMQTLI